MHHPTDRIAHTTTFVKPVVEHWLEWEIAQWVHPEGSIWWSIAPWVNALTMELHLAPGTRNSSMGPPWRIDPTTHRTTEIRLAPWCGEGSCLSPWPRELWKEELKLLLGGNPCPFMIIHSSMLLGGYREYYTSTHWRQFILQWVVFKTYLTSESELDTFGNHEL